MRIGIDARELAGRATGVGRLLAGLIREWSKSASVAHEFVLYAHEPLGITVDARRFPTREIAGRPGTWWEQIRLPRAIARDNLDVFFAAAYTAPLHVDVPVVAAIYDVSYVAHPEWFRLREGMRRRWLTQKTADRARTIITISEFSRREISERLTIPETRIRLVFPGVDRFAAERPSHAEPRVLFVGSIFNRRHVPDLIRAIAALSRRHADISLDIVGDDRSFPPEDIHAVAASLGVDQRVRWHRFVGDEQLTGLYNLARAFAFLSEYEGLGLTPLEALAAGVPPVLYDTAVAREACGGAALYAPMGDRGAVVDALERALFDEPTRARILSAAPATLSRYDWARAAGETLAVLEEAGR
jgi:glycosyltransferase involved in cell wall biosynthesis